MSTSRLNFTGRKRIPREQIRVGINGSGSTAVVGATFDLGSMGFPDTARVVLEAQAGWTVQRFEWGTVAHPVEPDARTLTEFSSTSGLLFRLKVIATGDNDGRLLGVADKIKPTGDLDQAAQQSFVVVRPQDLGDRVWKLEFDESQPLLLVNNKLQDHHDFLKRRDVAALILPEVLHRILDRAIELGEDDDAADAWANMVIRLGERLAGRTAPDSDDKDEVERWIDEAISAFSRMHHFMAAFPSDLSGDLT